MTGPKPYSPDNPFAAPDFRDVTGGSSSTAPRYRPDNPFSPTAKVSRETFGPVAGTMRVPLTQGAPDTGLTGTAGEMARTVGDVAKAIALPVKGEVGRRLVSAGGHLLTNTAEGGSLAPIALPQVARYLTAQNAAQQAAETVTGIPADEGRVMATREAYRTALNDPMDRAMGITPLSNRPDVAPFDMAAQFAVPVLGERAAALGGNLAFRAGASGVTRDVAAGLNRPLTAGLAVTPTPPDLPPEVRFPPEKAAVVSVLDKQRNWDQTGRAAFVRGEGPGFGGEVPRAMTESGQPTPETARALSPDNPFASLTNERGALGVPHPQSRTPEFRRWFGSSKVRDSKGEPLTVFHGTPKAGFSDFDASRGIFFTDNPKLANAYTMARGPWLSPGEAPGVYQAHLSLQNPLVLDAQGGRWDNLPVPWQEWKPKVFGRLPDNAVSVEDALAYAKSQGHDGLIVRNVQDSPVHGDRTKGTVYAATDPKQVKSATGSLGLPFPSLDESGRIGPLYHGSPHKFEQFDLSKVGTGEGAQAYGHGLYFAENKGVAKNYREALASPQVVLNGEPIPATGDSRLHDMALAWVEDEARAGSGDPFLAAINRLETRAQVETTPHPLSTAPRPQQAADLIRQWKNAGAEVRPKGGAIYTAELPDAEVSDFLHWDKPANEQSPQVIAALRKAADVAKRSGNYDPFDNMAISAFLGEHPRGATANISARELYLDMEDALGGPDQASKVLRAAGIRGVRYLDGSSRSAGEGSYNYAVFDDKDIRILNREGKGALKYLTGLTGAGVGGAGGAAAGSQIGDTPEERRRNAIVGGILGAAAGGYAGVKGGQAVEAMGERGAAPIAPEAPPKKLADVRLKGEPLQGPLRKPEENTVKRLVLPDALSEQVRQIGREFTGPGYESFGQVKRKAQSLLKSNDIPIDFTRANRAEVLGAAALLRQNTEETGRLAVKLANPKLADVERAALEQQMAQLEQTSRTLFNSITSAKTEQARDLAANRILANLSNTPEHWQYRAQKIAERPLGDAENAKIRGLLDAGKRDEALRYIGSLKPTTMQERLLSAWKAMLLTNPRTHAANTASNIVFGLTEEAARNPASFYDWVATKLIGGDRTKTPTNLAILKASAEGAAKGLRQMPNRLRGLPTGRALEEGVIPHEAQWGHPILTTLFNAPFRFLEAADAPFFESALRGSLAEQATLLAKVEGVKGPAASRRVAALIDSPTDEMVGRALYDAAVRTYKDPTAVGNVLQSVQKNFPVAGNIVMPFTKTPGAVATRFAEYTPYGFVKGARLYKQAIAEAVDGLPNPRLKQMAAENLGRATVGLGPIALGALLYRQGKASGQVDPGDKSARDTQYLLGVPNDAFKIGGQWVEPNRLGPQGMLLSLGAVMAQQAAKNEQTPLGAVGGAAFAGVRTVTDQPFLTGVQSLLQAREGADNAARYFANLSGSLVPSVIGAVEATGDPYMRDAQTAGDKLRSRIPGKAEALPTRTDQLGQPAQRFGPGIQNLLSPIRTSPDRVTGNPILEEIRATGAEIPALGRHKDETPQAYQVRATVIGKRVQQAITDLMAAPEYRALPPEQRKDVLEDRVRAVRARAAKYPAGVTP